MWCPFSAVSDMKKTILILILLVFLPFSLSEAQLPREAETAGASFLKFGMGARAVGMGEAFTAVSGDIYSTYWNPAGLSKLDGVWATFMHNRWFQDISTEFFASAFSLSKNTFAFSFTINSVSDIERRETATTEPLSYFDARQVALGASWARDLAPKIDLGLTFKWLYEKIDVHTASGIAFDLGGIYSLRDDFKLGLAVLNLGPKMKFEEQKYSLPTFYKLGAIYSKKESHLDGYYSIALDLVKPTDDPLRVHTGAEYDFPQNFSLRLGYEFGYDEKGFTFGMGFKIRKYSIDYAFVPYSSDLGNTHRISFNVKL
jgi:hypothetical protein